MTAQPSMADDKEMLRLLKIAHQMAPTAVKGQLDGRSIEGVLGDAVRFIEGELECRDGTL